MTTTYELRLSDGSTVEWTGCDGPDAARNYVDAHRSAVVVAWRETQTYVGPLALARIID